MIDEFAHPITVLDSRTGDVVTLDHDDARSRIATGQAIETTPADPARADKWVAELRERVMTEAARRGFAPDIPAFEEYEAWCQERGFNALPAKIENLVLYLLTLGADGIQQHVLLQKATSVHRIHVLSNHPPRMLKRQAWNAYFRGLSFARSRLNIPALVELNREAPIEALRMFPDGIVPMRWNDVAA
jgi:hypothetical protein